MERDAVIDLAKFLDQRVRVKFGGGREVEGVLKGFDKLDNLGEFTARALDMTILLVTLDSPIAFFPSDILTKLLHLLPLHLLPPLVIDECTEYLRDPEDAFKVTENTRKLGLVVCRGPQVSLISPTEGLEQIENPFEEDDDEEEEEGTGEAMES